MATSIPASQARAQFTSDLVQVFTDKLQPTSFLRSFFPTTQSFVKYVSIQVRRNYENIAVDVTRGTEGNRNNFSKSTEKVFEPPYYREFFDLTDIDLYDRLFGSTAIDAGVYSQLLNIAADRLDTLRNKIERSYEKQCADVLTTGISTFNGVDTINFGRLSGSLVDKGSGNYWATGTINPFTDLETGCQFLRTTGKSPNSTFNAILGKTAQQDLFNNTIFQSRVQQNLNNAIDTIQAPQRNSTGAAFHGTLTAGSYRVNLWTYPQFYDASGTPTSYLDDKKVILIPETPDFKLAFAAVPQLLRTGNGMAEDMELPAPIASPYVVSDYVDQRTTSHILDVKSAGVAIPTAVDQIYTVQVVA